MTTFFNPKFKWIIRITIGLIVLWVVNLGLRRTGRILFFEHWTPFESLIVIGLMILFMICLYVFLRYKNLFLRIALVLGFLVIGFYTSTLALLSAKPYSVYEKDGYQIYVAEWRFFFSGSDGFYLKENMLTAVFIGSGEQSEEIKTNYYIEDELFYIIETHEAGEVKETIVSLKE